VNTSTALYWRYVRFIVIVLTVAALACGLLLLQRSAIISAIGRGLDAQICDQADLVASFIVAHPDARPDASLLQQRRLTVVAASGEVTYDSNANIGEMDNHNNRAEIQAARRDGLGVSRRRSDTLGVIYIYAARALPDGTVVRVAAPLSAESAWIISVTDIATWTTGMVIAVGALIVLIRFWRNQQRLLEFTDVARGFADGNFTKRASLTNASDLGRIGQELNALGVRLQESLQEIDRQRALLDSALGALSEGVACIDRLDRLVYANPAFRRLAAQGADVLNHVFYEHIPATAVADALARSRSGAAGDTAVEFTYEQRHLRLAIAPAGTEILVLVLHDQTEIKRLEGARRDFMAAVSHEFKTPLTSILGFSETLLDGALESDPATAREFVAKIARHAERLAELVTDVMSLTRLESGLWQLRREPLDISALARAVLDEFQTIAADKKVTLELEAQPAVAIESDREALRQLIGNLVSNAIRYNKPAGSVTVRLQRNTSTLTIEVIDTGIGIPSEHLPHIFDRFYRVDGHRSRHTGGTGLGLSIVKQMTELLGGTITVRSAASGSAFVVDFPITTE
jgi:two-component system, OmpR family, phosphate regulon sensor histidine kinase PhoR